MTEKELIFWRDHFSGIRTKSNCDWPAKIVNACILRLEGIESNSPAPLNNCQTNTVELGWKAKL